jgi:hypothetical protein
MNRHIQLGILTGIGTVAYCGAVALLMTTMNKIFAEMPGQGLAIVTILLLLVFSAAVTGSLVFGYPAYLFIQKKFKEGIYTVVASLLTIIVLGALIVTFLIFSW